MKFHTMKINESSINIAQVQKGDKNIGRVLKLNIYSGPCSINIAQVQKGDKNNGRVFKLNIYSGPWV